LWPLQAAPSAFNLDRGPGIADRAIDHPLGRRPESGLEAEPATSDHYFQAENRVSHALLLALNEDRRLLFLRDLLKAQMLSNG
jgi:hypothetical protein